MNRNTIRNTSVLLLVSLLSLSCANNNTSKDGIRLWPKIEPYESGYLKVSDIHEIYYEICGNPRGKPVFVIHGGPGVGCTPDMRRFFNPEKFLIVLHDQRGSGKSRPNAEISENNTQNLVEDIERLRRKLKLGKIILFGGSWGSTLSLAYAQTYPDNISGMVLRGIWLATKDEEEHFWNGIPKFFPEKYESLTNELPNSALPPNSHSVLKLMQSKNQSDRNKYAKLVSRFEYKASGLNFSEEFLDEYYGLEENMGEIYTSTLIEFYYSSNDAFLEEGQLLRDTCKIQNIPTIIVNGRYDVLCPPIFAYRLHKKLPASKLVIAEEAGHSMSEKPIQRELLKAMVEFE